MVAPQTTCMLIIGAYRDKEVSETHPLMLTLKDIRQTGSTINTITLESLHLEDVEHLIADTLKLQTKVCTPLAELVLRKTGGNPFFLRQFLQTLYEDDLLKLDVNRRVWTWELENIQQWEMTENVIELMAEKIQKLPDETQQILKLAACIGNQFDLQTLSMVHEKSQTETVHDLWKALQEELIIPLDDSYKYILGEGQKAKDEGQEFPSWEGQGWANSSFKFLHDRIRQAAYALFEEAERQCVHLAIGRSLLVHTPEADREEWVFDIANHLNHTRALITTSTEKTRLAELNLRAGKRAKASIFYQSAYRYLQQGMECLEAGCWQRQYQLTLTLHEETAEAAYLSGDFDTMEALTAVVLRQTREVLETVKVSEIRIRASIAKNQLIEAIRTGLGILRRLSVRLSEKPWKVILIYEFLKLKISLLGTPIEALGNLPTMRDPQILALARIMNIMASASYVVSPSLAVLLNLKVNYFSIRYGHNSTSPYEYGTYGLILCGLIGDIEAGYRFGQLALTLQRRLKAKEFETRTALMVHAVVRPWKEHLRNVLQPLHEAYHVGLETGDFEYAGYAAMNYARLAMFTGDNLAQFEGEIQQFRDVMAQLRQDLPLTNNKLSLQAVLNLRGKVNNPTRLVGESYDEERMTPLHQQNNNHNILSYTYVLKLILDYLFHGYSQALQYASIAEQYLRNMIASYYLPLIYFYDSLTG